MKKDPHPLMFRDLPVWLQDVLRSLSREGFIYIGRTGPGPGGIAAAYLYAGTTPTCEG